VGLTKRELLTLVAREPALFGFLARRRRGKSTSATHFPLEEAALAGWKNIVMDFRGEDFGIHLPNYLYEQVFRKIRQEMGIEVKPRGFSAEYFTPRWVEKVQRIPDHYELVSIPPRMLSRHSFAMLLGTYIQPEDVKILRWAWHYAGKSEATLRNLIEVLAQRWGSKVSPDLIDMFAQGLFGDLDAAFDPDREDEADDTPVSPENLLNSPYSFTVLSNFGGPETRDIIVWVLREIAFNLLEYVAEYPQTRRKIFIWFREIAEIAPRWKQKRLTWHGEDFLARLVHSYTQMGYTLTRIGWEAQSTLQTPDWLLAQTQVLIVGPEILVNDRDLARLKAFGGQEVGIPEGAINKAKEMMKDPHLRDPRDRSKVKPGYFIVLTWTGDWDDFYIPPSRSLRIPQHLEDVPPELLKWLEDVISYKDLSDLRRQVKIWFDRLASFFAGEDVTYTKPRRAVKLTKGDLLRQSATVFLLTVGGASYLAELGLPDDGANWSYSAHRIELFRHLVDKATSEGLPSEDIYWIKYNLAPTRLQDVLERNAPRRWLNSKGMIIGPSGDGDYQVEYSPLFQNYVMPRVLDISREVGGFGQLILLKRSRERRRRGGGNHAG